MRTGRIIACGRFGEKVRVQKHRSADWASCRGPHSATSACDVHSIWVRIHCTFVASQDGSRSSKQCSQLTALEHSIWCRESMLRGLSRVEGGDRVLFVRQFCGSPSTYIWQDEKRCHPRHASRGRRGTRGCVDASHCSPSISTLLSNLCGVSSSRGKQFALVWTMSTLCAALVECCTFSICSSVVSKSIWGKHKSGTNLPVAGLQQSCGEAITLSPLTSNASGTQRVRGSTTACHHRRTPSASEPDSARHGSAVHVVADLAKLHT